MNVECKGMRPRRRSLRLEGNDLNSYVGKIIPFDRRKYPFDQCIWGRIGAYLKTKNISPPAGLASLHEEIGAFDLDDLYTNLYAFIESGEFQGLYRDFLKYKILKSTGKDYLFQRKPCIRIHLPGTQTVQYHTDEWFGHGKKLVNFWMPLTDVSGSNSLQIADPETSMRAMQPLRKAKASMSQINEACARISRPIESSFGKIYVFNARYVHGSNTNRTGTTRVSMDFRLIPATEDTGSKDPREYYDSFDSGASPVYVLVKAAAPSVGATYLYPKYGFTRFIRAHYQRLICREYARKMNVKIVSESTEIFTMSHHPLLADLAARAGTHKHDCVILFSVLCLPDNSADIRRILDIASKNKMPLFFANEQINFPASGANIIEQKRQELLGLIA